MRVTASLTTMPDRYEKLVKTLQSLNKQTRKLDAIYLSLPETSKRLNIRYPELPKEISDLCTVVKVKDFGPVTKLLGGLLKEKDPETLIISFDDDMDYNENLVECLVNYHKKYPESAIGSSGMLLKWNFPFCAINPNEDYAHYRISKFKIPEEGRKVDSIYGYPGALYLRGMFPRNEFLEKEFLNNCLTNHDTLMNDDIMISGYLSFKNIERRIFKEIPKVGFIFNEKGVRVRKDNEISFNMVDFFKRINGAINTCRQLGFYQVTEPVDISETIGGISIIVILCIILIVILLIYLIYNKYSFVTPNMFLLE